MLNLVIKACIDFCEYVNSNMMQTISIVKKINNA